MRERTDATDDGGAILDWVVVFGGPLKAHLQEHFTIWLNSVNRLTDIYSIQGKSFYVNRLGFGSSKYN